MVETDGGVRLDTTLRTGACGTWWSASTTGGHPLGLLQLEAALIAPVGARARAAAAVAAIRDGGARGVLRTTELIDDVKRAWLVVATLPTPTLGELLAARPALAPGAAAGVAADVADALRDLHAIGLSHGDLNVDNVVITSGGAAAVVEVGVLTALRGTPTDVTSDARAFAGVARALGAAVSAVGAGTSEEADEVALLDRVAVIADGGDLAAATSLIAARAGEWPDFVARDSLVAARQMAMAAGASAKIPAQRTTTDGPAGPLAELTGPPVRLRFGRGVPTASTKPSPSGPSGPSAPSGSSGSTGMSRRQRRRSTRVLQWLVALVVLLGAGAAAAWVLVLR